MATVQFDVIQSAVIQSNGLAKRILRGVTVTGIDGLSTADPEILHMAHMAVTSAAGTTYPGHPDLFFVGVNLQGFTNNGVSGYAIYETFQGGAPSAYIIRNRSYASSVETNLIPGTRKPIKCSFISAGQYERVPEDYIAMRFNLPVRAIEVSGLVYGAPTAGFEQYVGYVNDAAWGPPGKPTLPKGWWLLQSYEDAISKYSGYYTYQAVAIAKTYEDWSATGVLFSSMTGKFVNVPQLTIDLMNAREYSYGFIFGDPSIPGAGLGSEGIVRVGGNPTTSFSAIFGF